MQPQHQAQKRRNPIIRTALSSHPSSWDDLADASPNTDIGDGSCVMSHLGMRLDDGRWLAYELQGDPDGVPVLCASFFAFVLCRIFMMLIVQVFSWASWQPP
jgi:hypothetical protein